MVWQVTACVLLIASAHAKCNDCSTGEDGNALLQTKASVSMEKTLQEDNLQKEALLQTEADAEVEKGLQEDEERDKEESQEDEEEEGEEHEEDEEDEDNEEEEDAADDDDDDDDDDASHEVAQERSLLSPRHLSFKSSIVKQHNIYRCMHGVGKLKWSRKLAASAKRWARKTRGNMVHSGTKYGENLYWATRPSGKAAVKSWYSEVKYTRGGRVSHFSGKTGHYTQVVWKGTKYVGCGTYSRLVVCQYSRAGNMAGGFRSNVKGKSRSYRTCRKKYR